jgi:hypothetical protein
MKRGTAVAAIAAPALAALTAVQVAGAGGSGGGYDSAKSPHSTSSFGYRTAPVDPTGGTAPQTITANPQLARPIGQAQALS